MFPRLFGIFCILFSTILFCVSKNQLASAHELRMGPWFMVPIWFNLILLALLAILSTWFLIIRNGRDIARI